MPGDALIGKRIKVLDKGYIELLDLMPHPDAGVSGDLAIVNAARVSYLGESKGTERDRKLLFFLMRHRHTSPFEMVEFKFRCRAPLLTWWQWVRHRTWSANAQSGRYTPFEEDDFYVPDVWRLQARSNRQASEGELDDASATGLTRDLIAHYENSFRLYRQALDAGVSRELARVFLPGFSVYYTWVMKVNAHNLMHFIKLRMAEDAQHEIRVYARAILEHFFRPALPWTAEAFETMVLNNTS
ncbi:MAG: FAD-dependent thymidylate synthase [Anaerolineaceae bacterium]|nr:FAD-dependent thymidylate synthase [Anaerolineaceae bacterium]MDE0329749.1 FAD-dependent thymidylate synthase [Anaerolineaceae bacterium]